MKNNFICKSTIILTLLISSNLIAQNQNVGFELEKMNVLYLGVDNPVKIISSLKYDSIVVNQGKSYEDNNTGNTNNNASLNNYYTIKKISETNTFNIKLSKLADCELSVYSNGKIIGTKNFKVKKIPNPQLIIGDVYDRNNIKKSELLQIPSIKCESINFEYESQWDILQFNIEKSNNGKYQTFQVTGSQFNAELKNWLKDIEINSKLYFSNVRVKAPDGTIRVIPGLNLDVIE